MSNIPAELAYTSEHEWVKDLQDDNTYRVGITDHAQDELGEVVFVDLPQVGDQVSAGSVVGEIESTKSVSDLFVPISGEITEVNPELEDNPGAVNASPYEDGWLFTIRADSPEATKDLLDADQYQQQLD
ncbi:glycine cleavage system protein GcvH [Kocuria sp.]|jgi:glycine cleavage system H protein|uniref:glycine cleavage system protein GcvH n=1 Tax=Kocuria sp. TaxID=1871328 RepID=UPI0026E07C93|nr:glycine cleavage system protein GcvH [Kocuria sp.]MDO5366485.1 glycine cleavage system protein GcvH [Kocuria sp.]